jgi:ribonuclease HI
MAERISVFCDGSSLNNNSKKGDKAGGIGVFFGENDARNISEAITSGKITNQVAELLAAIKALYILKNDNYKGFVYIYTDSMYVVNCMVSYCKKWEKQGWKKEDKSEIENLELIQELYKMTREMKVIYKHCRAHQEEPAKKDSDEYRVWYGNNMADMLATAASKGAMPKKEIPKKAK